jgi:hypothetical protein
LVFLNFGFEILVSALVIEIIHAIFKGTNKREPMITRDFADGEFGWFRW